MKKMIFTWLLIVKLESKQLVVKNDDNQEIPFYDE